VIRTRINRILASAITSVLTRLPTLEQFVSARTDARRLHIALTRLRRRGLQIATVYDIGAHRGDWTQTVRPSLPGARFFLFEANDAHADALRETGERHFIAILSSDEQFVDFYGSGGSGDSYFREVTPRYEGLEPRHLQATTLDHMIETHDLPYPDFIKADVQGAELDVLRGGRDALGKAKLVLLECPVVEYNVGAPTIDEYFRFMDEHGFAPFDFVKGLWQRGQMVQVDVLFANVRAHPELIP
jgi:FkbM family methyltransferase